MSIEKERIRRWNNRIIEIFNKNEEGKVKKYLNNDEDHSYNKHFLHLEAEIPGSIFGGTNLGNELYWISSV